MPVLCGSAAAGDEFMSLSVCPGPCEPTSGRTDGSSPAPAAAGCRAFVTLLLIFCGFFGHKRPAGVFNPPLLGYSVPLLCLRLVPVVPWPARRPIQECSRERLSSGRRQNSTGVRVKGRSGSRDEQTLPQLHMTRRSEDQPLGTGFHVFPRVHERAGSKGGS